MRRKYRRYTDAEKNEAVQRVNDLRATAPLDRTIVRQVAEATGVSDETIRLHLRETPGTVEWNRLARKRGDREVPAKVTSVAGMPLWEQTSIYADQGIKLSTVDDLDWTEWSNQLQSGKLTQNPNPVKTSTTRDLVEENKKLQIENDLYKEILVRLFSKTA